MFMISHMTFMHTDVERKMLHGLVARQGGRREPHVVDRFYRLQINANNSTQITTFYIHSKIKTSLLNSRYFCGSEIICIIRVPKNLRTFMILGHYAFKKKSQKG